MDIPINTTVGIDKKTDKTNDKATDNTTDNSKVVDIDGAVDANTAFNILDAKNATAKGFYTTKNVQLAKKYIKAMNKLFKNKEFIDVVGPKTLSGMKKVRRGLGRAIKSRNDYILKAAMFEYRAMTHVIKNTITNAGVKNEKQ